MRVSASCLKTFGLQKRRDQLFTSSYSCKLAYTRLTQRPYTEIFPTYKAVHSTINVLTLKVCFVQVQLLNFQNEFRSFIKTHSRNDGSAQNGTNRAVRYADDAFMFMKDT